MPSAARALPPFFTVWICLAVAAAGCANVQLHRTLPTLAVTDPSFPATLEAYTGAPVSGGNAVRILLNGDQIFPEQLSAIRGARESITYAQYSSAAGVLARVTIEALADRCRAGVTVSVLFDAIGSVLFPPEYDTLLRDAGCQLSYFRPVFPSRPLHVNYRNHRRTLVVDGRVGFTGGSGLSSEWEGDGRTEGQWRDTDVRVEGPAVRFLQGAFVESWLEATGAVLGGPAYFPEPMPSMGTVRVQFVSSSPAQGNFSMYTMFLLAIEGARRSIHITNSYFVPDDRLTEALVRAAARGVRVVVLLPGDTDWNLVRFASRRALGPLLQHGVEVHEYEPALLHAKSMVVDGVWATVGSTNIDNRSFALNAELNAVLYGADMAGQLDHIFIADLDRARRLSYEAWSRRPLWHRFVELLAWPLREQF